MKIQIKRNSQTATAQQFSMSAGEPLWYKDRLFVGSVGTDAGGVTGLGGAVELAKDDDLYMRDGFIFPKAVQDIDGNWYDATVIGNQVWMTHNFASTKMPDGTPITAHTSGSFSYDVPKYTYFTTTGNYIKHAGLLYNWAAAVNGTSVSSTPHQGIAPSGWHIPTEAEWRALIDYLKSKRRYLGSNYPNGTLTNRGVGLMRAVTTNRSGLIAYDSGSAIGDPSLIKNNNTTGLSLVGGGRYYTDSGASTGSKPWWNGYYWSVTDDDSASTKAKHFFNLYTVNVSNTATEEDLYRIASKEKNTYLSVRCISDLAPRQFKAWYYTQYGSFNHIDTDSLKVDVIDLRH